VRSVGSPRSIRSASEQRLARSRVLGRALAQPQHLLVTPAVDADRGQHQVLGEAHPVDHHRDQVQPAESALHQRREFAHGAEPESLADHALADAVYFSPLGSVSSERA
jgi:hypothetical protein